MDDVGGAYPAFADASKRHDETSLGTALHEFGDIVLEFGGIGESEGLPRQEQKVPKVSEFVGYVGHMRGVVRLSSV